MTTTTICQHCLKAALKAYHGFSPTCPACAARSASRSPQFGNAKRQGRIDHQYKGLLAQFGLTHQAVKAAYDADAINRAGESWKP